MQIILELRDDIFNLLSKYAKNAGVSVEELVTTILSFVTMTIEHFKFFQDMIKKREEM